MKVLIWILAALAGYLVAGINPAIVFFFFFYHQDIRTLGSGNPGFTNFKRVFGNKFAWYVLILDLVKSAIVCFLFGLWFRHLYGWMQIGIAYTAVFSVLGHAYPVYYKFQGGKGFLVNLSVLYLLDWRVGLIATGIMVVLLLTVKYMSLATMCALVAGTLLLIPFGCDRIAILLYGFCVIFMIVRHRENIKRLLNHTESKFSLGGSKQKSE